MIHFVNVSKNFGTQQVLDQASFSVYPKDRCGVVGPNGAGKSTVFNLLTGELLPDKGEILRPNGLRLGYVRQLPDTRHVHRSVVEYVENAIPELGGIEERIHDLEHRLSLNEGGERELAELGRLQTEFEHLGGYDLRHRAESTLSGLGFSQEALGRPFKSFSGGWQMRAELAKTLIAAPDILLLDEPTNYLDLPAIEWLDDYLQSFQGTLLLISHDRFLLNTLTTRTLEVAGAKVSEYHGNYDRYVQERDSRYEILLNAKRNQDREVGKIQDFVERFRYKATKSNQVQSRIKQLEKIEEIVVPESAVKYARIRLPPPPSCGAEVLRFQDAGFGYRPGQWIFRHLGLTIERGRKVAVVGLNGLGKTTLLRIIAGRLPLAEGSLSLGHNVGIGYQAQDFTDTMDPDRTVYETARRAGPDREDREIRNVLGSFRFSGEAIEKRVGVLSGGEKVRLGLCRLLLSPCNFLVMDEPTTHLDIGTRESLEEALADYQGTLCVVSHDIQFLRKVADTTWAISPEGVTKYFGGYDYYHEKLAEQKAAAKAGAALQTERKAEVEETASSKERDKNRKREQAQLRQELARLRKPLEARVAQAESEILALEEEQQGLVAVFSAGAATGEQARRLGILQKELQAATTAWETAGTELESLQEHYRRLIDEAATP